MYVDPWFISKYNINIEECFVDKHIFTKARFNDILGIYAIKKVWSAERSERPIFLFDRLLHNKNIGVKKEIGLINKQNIMKKAEHILTCKHCKKEFKSYSKVQKYCSNTCKGYSFMTNVKCGCCGEEMLIPKHLSNDKIKKGHKVYCVKCVESKEYYHRIGPKRGVCTYCGCSCSVRKYKFFKRKPFCTNECKQKYIEENKEA
jgi:hypothetical protein